MRMIIRNGQPPLKEPSNASSVFPTIWPTFPKPYQHEPRITIILGLLLQLGCMTMYTRIHKLHSYILDGTEQWHSNSCSITSRLSTVSDPSSHQPYLVRRIWMDTGMFKAVNSQDLPLTRYSCESGKPDMRMMIWQTTSQCAVSLVIKPPLLCVCISAVPDEEPLFTSLYHMSCYR